jgi:hypothetical protein
MPRRSISVRAWLEMMKSPPASIGIAGLSRARLSRDNVQMLIRFATLVSAELGGFTRPCGYDND